MDTSNMTASAQQVAQTLTHVALRAAGAIVLYMVGRALIAWLIHLVQRSLEKQRVDPTLLRYVGTIISVLANIALVVAILGYFGVETTSFAALLAGAGLAIGTAWGGLLTNFAAGAFLVMLRPYKVGDYVIAGDVEGTVRTIGLFVTTLDTPDNVQTHVGNGKILNGTIKNFSANSHRRVELLMQLNGTVDVADAIARVKAKLATIPNVVATPAPEVEVLTFTELGPVLAVRPYTHTDHYWQVYFETNKMIVAAAGEGKYPGVARTIHVVNAS